MATFQVRIEKSVLSTNLGNATPPIPTAVRSTVLATKPKLTVGPRTGCVTQQPQRFASSLAWKGRNSFSVTPPQTSVRYMWNGTLPREWKSPDRLDSKKILSGEIHHYLGSHFRRHGERSSWSRGIPDVGENGSQGLHFTDWRASGATYCRFGDVLSIFGGLPGNLASTASLPFSLTGSGFRWLGEWVPFPVQNVLPPRPLNAVQGSRLFSSGPFGGWAAVAGWATA